MGLPKDINQYIAEQKYDRKLLKKRRVNTNDPFSFQRVGLRKRQKTEVTVDSGLGQVDSGQEQEPVVNGD